MVTVGALKKENLKLNRKITLLRKALVAAAHFTPLKSRTSKLIAKAMRESEA